MNLSGLLDDLGKLLIFTGTVVLGIVVWFGISREWLMRPGNYRPIQFAMPWFGLACIVYAVAMVAIHIWPALRSPVVLVVIFGPVVLGFFVCIFEHPRWALPRWYREWKGWEQPTGKRPGDIR